MCWSPLGRPLRPALWSQYLATTHLYHASPYDQTIIMDFLYNRQQFKLIRRISSPPFLSFLFFCRRIRCINTNACAIKFKMKERRVVPRGDTRQRGQGVQTPYFSKPELPVTNKFPTRFRHVSHVLFFLSVSCSAL